MLNLCRCNGYLSSTIIFRNIRQVNEAGQMLQKNNPKNKLPLYALDD